jgi:NTE family protein
VTFVYEDETMTQENPDKSIGLALSGGAVLGAAHIGVLRALEEEGIRASCVAGTSAGAIVGALYAFGLPIQEIETLICELSWLNIANIKPSRLGLLSISRLGEFLIDTLGDVNVEDAKLPLAIVAADIHTGERLVLREGNLATAVTASSCIPGIFTPVQWQDRLLVDGGIVENLPVDTVRELGADSVIGVNLFTAGLYPEPKTIIDVVLNASNILIAHTRLSDKRDHEVIVTPELNAYSSVDTGHLRELVEEGYRAAVKAMDEIRRIIT